MFIAHVSKSNSKILGISLLEVMLSVIVITAILVASIRYYTLAQENARIARAVEMLNNVATASFKWVEGQNQIGFDGITIAKLADSGLLPQIYKTETETINPWRGKLAADPAANNSVIITLGNVPPSSCANLKQKIINIGGNAGNCGDVTGDFTATWSQQE